MTIASVSVGPPKLLLEVAEVSGLTDLSHSHLYVEMGAGRLMYVKAGRRRLIRVGDLEAYVAALSSQPVAGRRSGGAVASSASRTWSSDG